MFTEERFADAGRGIELCFQTLGDPADPPLLMVMGLGSQMIAWPDELCELLAAGGLHLVRFDNRDCGRSTILDRAGTPSLTRAASRQLADPPYLLSDMADDCIGLLDALGIDSAHVCGASLGGFVSQTLAIEHPERVRSLASIMSSTGDGAVGQPHPEALEVLMSRPPGDLDGYLDWAVANRRVIGSPGFELDERRLRRIARRVHERGIHPAGTLRQLVASICSGDRTEALGALSVPTVVIHGTDDALIDVSGGRATAAAIPGAELVLIDGMGHDFPAAVWDRVADAILANVERGAERVSA